MRHLAKCPPPQKSRRPLGKGRLAFQRIQKSASTVGPGGLEHNLTAGPGNRLNSHVAHPSLGCGRWFRILHGTGFRLRLDWLSRRLLFRPGLRRLNRRTAAFATAQATTRLANRRWNKVALFVSYLAGDASGHLPRTRDRNLFRCAMRNALCYRIWDLLSDAIGDRNRLRFGNHFAGANRNLAHALLLNHAAGANRNLLVDRFFDPAAGAYGNLFYDLFTHHATGAHGNLGDHHFWYIPANLYRTAFANDLRAIGRTRHLLFDDLRAIHRLATSKARALNHADPRTAAVVFHDGR